MSARMWITVFSLGSLLFVGSARGQGFVREKGPRRPLESATAPCETWHGEIDGNDPSARIIMELCVDGARVTGTFFWSSAISGWDRRALEGEWRDDGHVLAARDTAMLEAHPLHGWTLCASDSYTLRRVSSDRLEGVYTSVACRDRGRLSLRRHALPPRAAPHPPVAPPPLRAALSPGAHHTIARCAATPGLADTTGGGAVWVGIVAIYAAGIARRRRQSGRGSW